MQADLGNIAHFTKDLKLNAAKTQVIVFANKNIVHYLIINLCDTLYGLMFGFSLSYQGAERMP